MPIKCQSSRYNTHQYRSRSSLSSESELFAACEQVAEVQSQSRLRSSRHRALFLLGLIQGRMGLQIVLKRIQLFTKSRYFPLKAFKNLQKMKLKMIKDSIIITNFMHLLILYVYFSLFSRNDGTKLN